MVQMTSVWVILENVIVIPINFFHFRKSLSIPKIALHTLRRHFLRNNMILRCMLNGEVLLDTTYRPIDLAHPKILKTKTRVTKMAHMSNKKL